MCFDASFTVLIPAGAGIFNLLCIRYALRPRVSSRLTLGGRTWPRKPWVYGDQDSHLVYRYSCLHSHFCAVHYLRLGLVPRTFSGSLQSTQNALLPLDSGEPESNP